MINNYALRTLCICALPLMTTSLVAQQNVIKGKVIDKETGEQLIGATLQNLSNNKYALTDSKGAFALQAQPNDTIQISYVGYKAIRLTGQTLRQQPNILLSGYKQLNEVTVTASIASARNRKAIGADVASVNVSKLMHEGNGNSLSELLDGRISGVQMFQTNGKVGMPIRFNMRSGATLSLERDPIIYVDGVRYNNTHTSDINNAQDAMSSLTDLQLEDIATIDIIKGPAAAASYGAEAANGVIVITTKRQSSQDAGNGKLTANVKYTEGFSQLARQYNQFVNNDPVNNFFVTGRQTNLYANISKSFSAGNKIYFSANAKDDSGIIPGNRDKRYNFRAAYDLRQGSFFANLSASYTNGAMSIPQTAQGRMDAIWNLIRTRKPWGYVDEDTWRAQSWTYDNDRFIASAKLGYTLPYQIKAETQFGVDVNFVKGIYRLPFGYTLGTNDQGDKKVSHRRNFNLNWDWKLYRKFELADKWTLTGTVLSQIVRRYETVSTLNSSFFSADVDNLAAGSKQEVGESDFEQRTWGLYGEAFLNYDNKLFINLGLRRDASNLIGADVTSIYYPSLSVSYNWNQFKVRTAYGESGRLPYPTDARTAYVLSGLSAYGPILKPGTRGNTSIRPERMRELEAGIDWNGKRQQISFTAYYQRTSDAIIYAPLLSSDGWIGNEPRNIGSVHGWGAELSYNIKAYESQKSELSLFATASYQANKVLSTGGEIVQSLPNVIREGYPAYAFVQKKVIGANYDKEGKFIGAKESSDEHYLGKPFPDFNGAFGADWKLFDKKLSLGIKFNYSVGASLYNMGHYLVAQMGDNLKKVEILKDQLKTQTVGSDGYKNIAEQLAFVSAPGRSNYIERADFIRLSSLTLGYDFSSELCKISHKFIKGGRLQLSAQNLVFWTNYSGIEPQIEANGGTRQSRGMGNLSRDIYNAPTPRSFTATLSLNF